MEPKLIKITGLYKKEAKSGTTYLQGSIKIGAFEGFVKLFPVADKKTDKHPDYNITLDFKDNENGLINVGGLWKDKDKDGNLRLTGRLGGVYVNVLKNTFKEGDTQPDYNLFIKQIVKKEEAA